MALIFCWRIWELSFLIKLMTEKDIVELLNHNKELCESTRIKIKQMNKLLEEEKTILLGLLEEKYHLEQKLLNIKRENGNDL